MIEKSDSGAWAPNAEISRDDGVTWQRMTAADVEEIASIGPEPSLHGDPVPPTISVKLTTDAKGNRTVDYNGRPRSDVYAPWTAPPRLPDVFTLPSQVVDPLSLRYSAIDVRAAIRAAHGLNIGAMLQALVQMHGLEAVLSSAKHALKSSL